MPKHGKRYCQARKEVGKPAYTLQDAVELLKRLPGPKFDQSVEVHLKLGIDPKQSDQNLRGSISLPAGLGQTRTVVAFCPPETSRRPSGSFPTRMSGPSFRTPKPFAKKNASAANSEPSSTTDATTPAACA